MVVPDVFYDKHLFVRKLREIGTANAIVDEVFSGLPEKFTMHSLEVRLHEIGNIHRSDEDYSHIFHRDRVHILSLAQSNYEVNFTSDQPLCERNLFPTAPTERNGLEDARFVQFTDDASTRYYATYTAYNGVHTVPQLIETSDFLGFQMSTLNGPEVHNKGMALFPRKINGLFAMLGRQDNENLYFMLSEHPHFWSTKQLILAPKEPWELIQLGNCGSPIETEHGWLVLTHGVGPMRQYSISAILLDFEDPTIVIGRLKQPLLVAEEDEREGYVPNVVYSCGAVVHGDKLILPYAVSDYSSSIATVDMRELLEELLQPA